MVLLFKINAVVGNFAWLTQFPDLVLLAQPTVPPRDQLYPCLARACVASIGLVEVLTHSNSMAEIAVVELLSRLVVV